jgi:paraquat-inducible protein B
MSNSFTVKVGESVVEINPDDLKFTDATINVFFERISGKIDYIGRCLANAQRICSLIEQKTEFSFINEFKKCKEEGKSDKSAELYAKGSDEVQKYKKALIESKHIKDILYHHLQSLNSGREDAHNRGHMLRKEMDKLSNEFLKPRDDFDQTLGGIIGELKIIN